MDDPDFESRQGKRIFLKTPTMSLRTHPTSCLMGYGGTFLVLKRPGRDADRFFPSSSGAESE